MTHERASRKGLRDDFRPHPDDVRSRNPWTRYLTEPHSPSEPRAALGSGVETKAHDPESVRRRPGTDFRDDATENRPVDPVEDEKLGSPRSAA